MMSPDSEMVPLAVLFVLLVLAAIFLMSGHFYIASAFLVIGIIALLVEW